MTSFAFLAEATLRRLADALVSDNDAAFSAEQAELRNLVGVVQQRHAEATQLATELACEGNRFLSPVTNLRVKQQAAPLAQALADRLAGCLAALDHLGQEVRATNPAAEFARQNAAETISAVQYSAVWRRGFGLEERDRDESPFSETMELLDKLDMSMSPKDAKRSLTKEQYKEWKRIKSKMEAKDSYWS